MRFGLEEPFPGGAGHAARLPPFPEQALLATAKLSIPQQQNQTHSTRNISRLIFFLPNRDEQQLFCQTWAGRWLWFCREEVPKAFTVCCWFGGARMRPLRLGSQTVNRSSGPPQGAEQLRAPRFDPTSYRDVHGRSCEQDQGLSKKRSMNKLREDKGCSAITHHKNVPLKKVFAKKKYYSLKSTFFKSLLVKKMELIVSPSPPQSDQAF